MDDASLNRLLARAGGESPPPSLPDSFADSVLAASRQTAAAESPVRLASQFALLMLLAVSTAALVAGLRPGGAASVETPPPLSLYQPPGGYQVASSGEGESLPPHFGLFETP